MRFTTVRIPQSSAPLLESDLLVRFLVQRCQETLEPSPVLLALALAAVAHDETFHNRFKEVVRESEEAQKIFRISAEVFAPALDPYQEGRSLQDDESASSDETSHDLVLSYALVEAEKMLAEAEYDFVNVFAFLVRAALTPYCFRFYEFEAIRETFRDDPKNLVRKGVEIITTALGSPEDEK